MKYIAKPTEIEAILFKSRSLTEAWLLVQDHTKSNHYWSGETLYIKPTTGKFITVPNGYYVIKETAGFKGFYPCNPDIFNNKYKPA